MTEQEWLACSEPDDLLETLPEAYSHRKARLFACAVCRQVWQHLPDSARVVIELAERFADDPETRERIPDEVINQPMIPEYQLQGEHLGFARNAIMGLRYSWPLGTAAWAVRAVVGDVPQNDIGPGMQRERSVQSSILRDIFGTPFRHITLDPRWQTETVVTLAAGIYADRAFDRMPILADALEEAGCDNSDILNHRRGDGPHVRGCWVVDLLLGKE